MFHPIFWIKTIFHLAVPGGFGYNRTLRHQKDQGFDIEHDRHPVRQKHRGDQGWKDLPQGDLIYRDYSDYDEYVMHQRQKYDEILKSNGGFSGPTIARWRVRFYNRFKHIGSILPKDATILCAGARQGTEVEVLRDLGFKNAYGIDLNPGPNNPFVTSGDFLRIKAPDHSIDLLYSNSIDHAFELNGLFAEHSRVIKSGGYALYDIPSYQRNRDAGPFEAVQWQSLSQLKEYMLKHFKQIKFAKTEPKWTWFLVSN